MFLCRNKLIVFWQIRVPRILAALFLGAALAGAGTTYQGMFRNPLVSPDILGVSAGAGLGACAAILWGLSIVYIQLYAFCGGLMVVAGVWLITRRVTRHDPILTLVLVGIALGTLCGAGISLIKTLADPYTQLPSIDPAAPAANTDQTDSDYLTLPVALLPVSSYRPAAFVVQSRKFHLADYQVLLPLTPSNPPKTGLVWRLPPDISCAS